MTKINVLGLGYIGLPTASMFATHGFNVCGVDINHRLIHQLNDGEVLLQEPGLQTLVQAALKSGQLSVKSYPEKADVHIIAVPTPILPDKKAELSYVVSAAQTLCPLLEPNNIIILESTVPPGTTRNVLVPILAETGLDPYQDLHIVHSPERVLPGRILNELVENARVIGGLTTKAAELARDLYMTFVQGEIHLTDVTAAEMIKVMENTYRDVNIALANEFALIAESIGVNVWEAIEIANLHPRVNILRPGPGVGGHCIAVDPWFLVQAAPGPSQLIASSRRINDRMPLHVAEQVQALLKFEKSPKIVVLGLAYKANVDDYRESPSISVIRWLQAAGYEVVVFDPHIENVDFLPMVSSMDEAIEGAACLLVLTDHAHFKHIDPYQIKDKMRGSLIVDTRKIIDQSQWEDAGFEVHVLGDGFRGKTFDDKHLLKEKTVG